ncbi:hypothetical protein WN48_07162 [Eufriesea mexicana]|uniref:Uncharacterized protein n=1 Tax=Eufriesea mexicana TaxID=516756 RepID=A0A310SSA9_9HYME|nr:hypothetical protein WN48_07162 [Eufriesea mexicana]
MGITMAGVVKCIKHIYYDPFKWSVVKSIGLFALGVKIAIECKGVDLMPPIS